ncbi:RBBP9/YdeN family alpha/beta hydrolase [Trinickia dinghuensis]|uniref:Serine hydrolase family protein n=1 Tax=Trinickia dinghuensis TaxID=2291023 RepID=A0A3D8JVW1_9BURK|nr:alpha/beta hydrolase [Trinickia dinghuensis]RDU96932.1 serine hydrolase family protein [Trinickia dinghuensis]
MSQLTQTKTYVLPGYGNSGPGHWQTRWEALDASFVRVAMPDWDRPVREAWCETLDRTVVSELTGPLRFAAHSLGCLTLAHWALRIAGAAQIDKIAGALLVAPPDPSGPGFPRDAAGYGDLALAPLPFPSIVVASSDDPYGSLAFAERCARAWGSRLVEIGPRGHINADSGLGDWEEGRRHLASFLD